MSADYITTRGAADELRLAERVIVSTLWRPDAPEPAVRCGDAVLYDRQALLDHIRRGVP